MIKFETILNESDYTIDSKRLRTISYIAKNEFSKEFGDNLDAFLRDIVLVRTEAAIKNMANKYMSQYDAFRFISRMNGDMLTYIDSDYKFVDNPNIKSGNNLNTR